jgi:hypothetical protein
MYCAETAKHVLMLLMTFVCGMDHVSSSTFVHIKQLEQCGCTAAAAAVLLL